jgi:hypothetical protein
MPRQTDLICTPQRRAAMIPKAIQAATRVQTRRGLLRLVTSWSTRCGQCGRLPAADVADLVQHMPCPYRLPDALRRADTLARVGRPGATVTGHQPG